MATLILPYPDQLPQDYYAKNLPTTPPPTSVTTPPTSPEIITPPEAVNNGGAFYGDVPPSNPQLGWIWSNTKGAVFVFMEPGIWSQIGTNW